MILGSNRAFDGTSSSTLLPQIVTKSLLQQAIAWSSSAGQTAQILGPFIGGLLYTFVPTMLTVRQVSIKKNREI